MPLTTSKTNKALLLIGLVIGLGGITYLALEDDEPLSGTTDNTLRQVQLAKQHQHITPKTDDTENGQHAGLGIVSSTDSHAATLNLNLLAIVYSDDQAQSSATIESPAQVHTYYVDDRIDGTELVVVKIQANKVTLRNAQNQHMVLRMAGGNSAPDTRPEKIEPGVDNDTHTAQQQALAKSIGNRPKQLEHIVTTMPAVTRDGINGFTVAPGDNPSLFRSAGFKDGDVLTQINGLDLSNPEQYAAAMAAIPTADTLAFTVIRGGRTITLYLDIPAKGLSVTG